MCHIGHIGGLHLVPAPGQHKMLLPKVLYKADMLRSLLKTMLVTGRLCCVNAGTLY